MAKSKRMRAAALKMIGANDFKNLVKQCDNLKQRAGSFTSEMGGLISNAAENKHLDKKAFSIFRALHKMDVQKLATTLACFDYYRDIGGLDKMVEDAPSLEIARPEAGETETPEPRAARKEKTLTEAVVEAVLPRKKERPARALARAPSKAAVKAAADRAEARSKSNVVPMAQAAE